MLAVSWLKFIQVPARFLVDFGQALASVWSNSDQILTRFRTDCNCMPASLCRTLTSLSKALALYVHGVSGHVRAKM